MTRSRTVLVSLVLVLLAVLPACSVTDDGEVRVLDALTGRVVTLGWIPRELVDVRVGALDLTTGSDGTFTASDVAVPYDATATVGTHFGHSFLGLSNPQPTLVLADSLFGTPPTLPREATLQGDLSEPVPPEHQAVVCVEGHDHDVYGCGTVAPGGTAYMLGASWLADESIDLTAHALLYRLESGIPADYPAYGSAEASDVADGSTRTLDIGYATDPDEWTGSFRVAPPAGLDDVSVQAGLRYSDRLVIPLANYLGVTPGLDLALTMPDIGEGSVQFTGRASSSTSLEALIERTLRPTPINQPELLAFDDLPSLEDPSDGAVGVGPGSEFAVDDAYGGTTTFVLEPADAAQPTFAVTGRGERATLPDFGAAGLELPAMAPYDLTAVVAPNADEAGTWIDPRTLADLTGPPGGPGGDGEFVLFRTAVRGFTFR